MSRRFLPLGLCSALVVALASCSDSGGALPDEVVPADAAGAAPGADARATGDGSARDGTQAGPDGPGGAQGDAAQPADVAAAGDASDATDASACEPAYGTFAPGRWPPACWRPYAATGYFNTPVPANPKLATGSAVTIASLIDTVKYFSVSFGSPGGAQTDCALPFYWSQATDPLFTIHCSKEPARCGVDGLSIRIPDAAVPEVCYGGDGHMTVIDQTTGWEYDFFRAYGKPQGGGDFTINFGNRTKIDGDGREPGGSAVAANFGTLAGVIRPQEIEAENIEHALALVVPCVATPGVFPSDGGALPCTDPTNKLYTGSRVYLAMTNAEIDAASLTAFQRIVFRALAKYGAYVTDTIGPASGVGSMMVQVESSASFDSFGYPSPWPALATTYGGVKANDYYNFFLFAGDGQTLLHDRMRVVDPCVMQGSC